MKHHKKTNGPGMKKQGECLFVQEVITWNSFVRTGVSVVLSPEIHVVLLSDFHSVSIGNN